MNRKLIALALCWWGLVPLTSFSQNALEVLNMEYQISPQNTLKNWDGKSFSAPSQQFNVGLRFPLFYNQQWRLLGSAMYKNVQTDQEEYEFMKQISGLSVGASAQRAFNNWSIIASSEMSYNADRWARLSMDDIIARGILSLIRSGTGTISNVGLGLGCSSDFGVPTIIPLFFFSAQPAEKVHFNLVLPLKSSLSYHWNNNTRLGVNHSIHYNAFRITEADQSSNFYFGKDRTTKLALFAEQKLYRNIWAGVQPGVRFRSVVYLFDEERNELERLRGKMNFSISFQLIVKIKKHLKY